MTTLYQGRDTSPLHKSSQNENVTHRQQKNTLIQESLNQLLCRFSPNLLITNLSGKTLKDKTFYCVFFKPDRILLTVRKKEKTYRISFCVKTQALSLNGTPSHPSKMSIFLKWINRALCDLSENSARVYKKKGQ